MQSDEEIYREMQLDPDAEQLSTHIIKMGIGDILIAEYLGEETVTPDPEKGPCQQYLLRTRDGLGTLILGSATDKKIDGKLEEGAFLVIKKKAQETTKSGNPVNVWDIRYKAPGTWNKALLAPREEPFAATVEEVFSDKE